MPETPPPETVTTSVNEAIEKRIARRGNASDETLVPDTGRVRQITAEEIETWWKTRPRWWALRKRRDSQIAAGGLAAVLLFATVDALTPDSTMMHDLLHKAAATDTRIAGTVSVKLEEWSQAEPFRQNTRHALSEMAGSKETALVTLVKEALDASPVVMFQAQATLGEVGEVRIDNPGCLFASGQTMTNPAHMTELLPELNTHLLYNCQTRAHLAPVTSLSVPFWARFKPDPDGIKDQVSIIVQVLGEAEEPDQTRRQFPVDKATKWSEKPARLTIGYQSSHPYANRASPTDLAATLDDGGHGFWIGTINDAVKPAIGGRGVGKGLSHEYFHSLLIELPERGLDCGLSIRPGSDEYRRECAEVYHVNVMIMINRAAR